MNVPVSSKSRVIHLGWSECLQLLKDKAVLWRRLWRDAGVVRLTDLRRHTGANTIGSRNASNDVRNKTAQSLIKEF